MPRGTPQTVGASGPSGKVATVSRIEELLGRLGTFYGALSAPPRDPFALFVWQVLDTRSAAHRRDLAFGALKRLRALTPDAMARVPQGQLEAAIGLVGSSMEQRLQALRGGANVFQRAPRLPALLRRPLAVARRALMPLPPLGLADAHRVLLFSGDHLVLPVDAHVTRVGTRLGYGAAEPSRPASARLVRRALEAELPRSADTYRRACVYLSHHGAVACTERSPHCAICPLISDCPSGVR